MKLKALRFIDTREFMSVENFNGELVVFTSDLPTPRPETATMETIIKYYDGKINANWDNIELLEFDLIESGVLGADIRNKLTPPLNLATMIKVYLDEQDNKHVSPDKLLTLKELIIKEIENSEKCIDYIAKLL